MPRMLTLLSTTAVAVAAVVTLTAAPKTAAACSESGSIYIGTVCMMAGNFCPDGYVEAQGQLLPINNYNALYSLVGVTYGGDARTNFAVPDFRGRSPIGLGQGPGLTLVQPGEKRGVEAVTLTQAQMPIHSHAAIFVPNTNTSAGKITVSVPEVTGTLNVDAKLPLVAAATGTATATPAPQGNANNYIGAVTGKATNGPANYPVNFTGLFSNSATAPTGGASSPVTVNVNGSPTIPAFSFDVPIGGNVNVGNSGGSLPATNIPPQQAVRFCLAVTGLYPPRP